MLEKLREILELVEYANSEVYSGYDSLPDYRANESSNDHMSNAECYLHEAEDLIFEMISEMNTEVDNDVDV
jgi:hypothetical protein|tara:strand:- start:357 stop:569 length:213 start_codon:yes stop_codon:yes gene_type:complete